MASLHRLASMVASTVLLLRFVRWLLGLYALSGRLLIASKNGHTATVVALLEREVVVDASDKVTCSSS